MSLNRRALIKQYALALQEYQKVVGHLESKIPPCYRQFDLFKLQHRQKSADLEQTHESPAKGPRP